MVWVPGYRLNRRMDLVPRWSPSFRRSNIFVSYCTSLVVCIARLYVAKKDYAAPPRLYMSDMKVNAAVLVYDN